MFRAAAANPHCLRRWHPFAARPTHLPRRPRSGCDRLALRVGSSSVAPAVCTPRLGDRNSKTLQQGGAVERRTAEFGIIERRNGVLDQRQKVLEIDLDLLESALIPQLRVHLSAAAVCRRRSWPGSSRRSRGDCSRWLRAEQPVRGDANARDTGVSGPADIRADRRHRIKENLAPPQCLQLNRFLPELGQFRTQTLVFLLEFRDVLDPLLLIGVAAQPCIRLSLALEAAVEYGDLVLKCRVLGLHCFAILHDVKQALGQLPILQLQALVIVPVRFEVLLLVPKPLHVLHGLPQTLHFTFQLLDLLLRPLLRLARELGVFLREGLSLLVHEIRILSARLLFCLFDLLAEPLDLGLELRCLRVGRLRLLDSIAYAGLGHREFVL
mmetsp:Transcript_11395/g.30489  ORF Transcript_11395/g.30489 Transcript_11395/m.30489 type:complete len:382 (-) Transcript_11395:1000-2145(-)